MVEHYRKTDIEGRTYQYELHNEGSKWWVACWKVSDDEGFEHQWEVSGVVTGYIDGNPNRPIHDPFTEETARAEYEKWRT